MTSLNLQKHRLVMFYGVSPGAGKTTLSEWLKNKLEHEGINTLWIEEHHVHKLTVFAEVVKVFTRGSDDYETPLLDAAKALITEYASQPTIVITDSLFPSYTWLFTQGVQTPEISAFSKKLASVLAVLNPLIVWLDGDVRTLLQRAVTQRGEGWLQDLIESLNSYVCVPVRPVTGIDEVVSFFEEIQSLQTAMFAEWPHKVLRLDITNTPIQTLQQQLERYLSTNQ
jgi:thymidylate kinase